MWSRPANYFSLKLKLEFNLTKVFKLIKVKSSEILRLKQAKLSIDHDFDITGSTIRPSEHIFSVFMLSCV